MVVVVGGSSTPFGKVPVVIHKGNTIYESLVTCEYIMDVFPGVKLHSEDPAQRVKDRMLVEVFNKVVMPLMRIWFGAKRGFTAEDRARQWTESMENLSSYSRESSRLVARADSSPARNARAGSTT